MGVGIYQVPAGWAAIVHLATAGEDDENLGSHYAELFDSVNM